MEHSNKVAERQKEEMAALQAENEQLQNKVDELEAKLKGYVDSKKFTPDEWYRFWRNALKDQATVTSGIFFIFTGANLGYLVNNHINKIVVNEQTKVEYVAFSPNESSAVDCLLISACCYGLLSLSRYFDYRLKTRKFKDGSSFEVVIRETRFLFRISMFFFLNQILFFALGFFFEVKEFYRLFY